MKKVNEKVLVIIIMILTYLTLSTIISATWWIRAYNLFINPICWIGMFSYCAFFLNNSENIRKSRSVVFSVLYITVLYLMIYFTTGLFVGYARNPFSIQPLALLQNIWSFVIILFFQEYVRSSIIKNSHKNKVMFIITAILFALVEINISSINNTASNAEIFKYIFQIIIPVLAKSILFTYLVSIGGYKASLAFKIPTTLMTITLPILPNYDWFLAGINELLITVIMYLYVSYNYSLADRRISRRQIKKENPISTIPYFIALVLMIGFVAGFFHYQPVAIVSNSMYPLYQRGDVVIVEHINEENLKRLEIGYIIEYILDGKAITHRIVEISTDQNGQTIYITQGDNNNVRDPKPVYENQILGIIKCHIPKIGYPSVWVSELLK